MVATKLTDLFGCRVPLQLAPMGTICTPRLIAAVTGAGGIGMLSLPMAPAAAVSGLLDEVRALCDGPFGFNVLIPFLDRDAVEAASSGCDYVDFYHGAVDASLVAQVHANGARAGWQVNSVADARAAADAGCDLIVVRGTEGGGRMHGERSLWPLLFEVLNAVEVPVIAAGGLADGRGLAAVLAAGAAGARMGTRFVATSESGAHDEYKAAIVRASGSETVLTDAFRELWPAEEAWSRVLASSVDAANRLPEGAVAGHMQMGPTTVDVPRFGVPPPVASSDGEVAAMAMYAGESVALIDAIEPAADVVQRIAGDADALLAKWVRESDPSP